MSAYGAGLFHDDVAVDVRDEYLALLASGATDAAAFRTMLLEWKESIADYDDGPVFWLALAATQWEYGRLHPRAKTEALKVIDEGKDIDRWAESGLIRRRQAVLAKLKRKLLAPLPKRRTPRLRADLEPPSNSATAPDGNAKATAWQFGTEPGRPQSQVYITIKVKQSEGGGCVFVASCELSDIKLKWTDADTVRITYPKQTEVEQQDATSFYFGRTIAVKYRRV